MIAELIIATALATQEPPKPVFPPKQEAMIAIQRNRKKEKRFFKKLKSRYTSTEWYNQF